MRTMLMNLMQKQYFKKIVEKILDKIQKLCYNNYVINK